MKRKLKVSSVIRTVCALLAVLLTMSIYGILLNRTVSDNMIDSIHELSEHDKRSIEAFVKAAWNELSRISQRLAAYDYEMLHDIHDLLAGKVTPEECTAALNAALMHGRERSVLHN